jgi:hypothetical protein
LIITVIPSSTDENTKYTTQLSQGAGLINEVLSLLSVYQKGMTYIQLTDYVRENGTLSCKTDSRLKHIVYDVFYVRLLKNNPDVAWWLKRLEIMDCLSSNSANS